MQYTVNSTLVRVRIIAASGWLEQYNGRECNAVIYESGMDPKIDSEQLRHNINPLIPRWQSCRIEDIKPVEPVNAQ